MGKPLSLASAMWMVALAGAVGGCSSDPGSATGSGGTGGSNSTATGSGGTGGAACVPIDDYNPCTDDVCDNGAPKSKPAAAGSPCSVNGTYCDGGGACIAPVCLGLSAVPSPSVGHAPFSLAAADLNGDGKPDLVTGNGTLDGSPGGVSVLLNQGNGTFAPAVEYAAGGTALAVAAADLDGDGNLDVVAANNNGKVSVLLNQGKGTFAAPVTYAAGALAISITAADLNGDGKPDLVTVYDKKNLFPVSVLLNQGNGTFAGPVGYAAGMAPFGAAAADLNGDGKPDLAVVNYNSDNVSVLFNQGNGTFAAPINYAAGKFPDYITAADLNGDGKPDLVTANNDSNNVSVLLNQGNGTFTGPVNFAAGSFPKSVVAADLNGDSKPDLAVSNGGGNVSVLFNQGNGTFAAPVNHAVGTLPYSVAAADLNGDGRPDLATANSMSDNVTVLLNTCLP